MSPDTALVVAVPRTSDGIRVLQNKRIVSWQEKIDKALGIQIDKILKKLETANATVKEIRNSLKDIATQYPTSNAVITKLPDFLESSGPARKELTNSGEKSKPIGRPRKFPRLVIGWSDGTSVELKQNPIRQNIAIKIRDNPANAQISRSEQGEYLQISCMDEHIRIFDPHPEKESLTLSIKAI